MLGLNAVNWKVRTCVVPEGYGFGRAPRIDGELKLPGNGETDQALLNGFMISAERRAEIIILKHWQIVK